VDDGINLLREVKRLTPEKYSKTPKGTPFYLLGIAAFLSHVFQTATYLFDAAATEDLTHYPNNKDTPALLTMRLENENPNQRALPIVIAAAKKIEAAIDNYNNRSGSKALTMDHVRQRFLRHVLEKGEPRLRTITTTFISFFFEWDYRVKLIELSEVGSREPFFAHLFRGCLLFESLLKENTTKSLKGGTLESSLKKLVSQLNL
jgi:hypothetical protein